MIVIRSLKCKGFHCTSSTDISVNYGESKSRFPFPLYLVKKPVLSTYLSPFTHIMRNIVCVCVFFFLTIEILGKIYMSMSTKLICITYKCSLDIADRRYQNKNILYKLFSYIGIQSQSKWDYREKPTCQALIYRFDNFINIC